MAGSNITSTLSIQLIDGVSKPARDVSQALKDAAANAEAVAKSMKDSGATDRFVRSLASLKVSAKDVEAVAGAWRDYSKAAGLAADSAKWTRTQAADVKAWESQTIKSLREVKREQQAFFKAQAAEEKQAQERARLTPPPAAPAARSGANWGVNWGVVGGAAGMAATYKAERFASQGVENYRKYSDENAIMRPVLDLTPDEQEKFKAQQMRLGVETRFSPVQIVEAQKLLGSRGVDKAFIESYIKHAVNYASAMNVDLPEATAALEAQIFSTGKLKGVTDPVQAEKIMKRTTDFSTHLAKVGGLSNQDVSDFYEYGGLSGKQAGISDETAGAMLAIMRHNQISGSKAGVAMRAISAKLVSPTAKGLAALNAMGIDYNQYTKMPGGLSGENLGLSVARTFGKKLTPDQIARLNALNSETYTNDKGEEAPIVGSREAYTTRASEIIGEGFEKKKNGELHAKDAKDIASTVGQFHKMAVESVNSEGLLQAIAESHATLAQLNAYFGFQQGSRAGAALQNPEELAANRKKLLGTPEGYAEKVAAERLASFDGAVENLEGSGVALQIRIANVLNNNDQGGGLLTGFVKSVTWATNAVIGLPGPLIALGTAATVAGTAFMGLKSIGALTTGFGLTGSAAALDGAAAALTAAAGRLGGAPGSIPETLIKGAAPAVDATIAAAPALVGAAGGTAGALIGGGTLAAIGTSALAAGAIMDNPDNTFNRGFDALRPGEAPKRELAPGHRPWTLGRIWSNLSGGGDTLPTLDESNASIDAAVAHKESVRLAASLQNGSPLEPSGPVWLPPAKSAAPSAGLDASQAATAKQDLDAAAQSKDALGAPVALSIDTSSIDALIAKIGRAKQELASLGAAGGSAGSMGGGSGGHFGLDGLGR